MTAKDFLGSPDPTLVASRPLSGLSGDASVAAHTPGPWECDDEAQVIAHNRVIAQCQPAPRIDMADANAARIVACVNACEGMDTPEASIAFLRERGEALTEANAQLAATERERDELAAALRAVTAAAEARLIHATGDERASLEDVLHAADYEAALAKAGAA